MLFFYNFNKCLVCELILPKVLFFFFFCAGISPSMKDVLLDELQMEEGHFPVRYLGVPLISSKLSAADYRVLIERITKRIDYWTSKQLSFDGRM
jgi:hypothetical protein